MNRNFYKGYWSGWNGFGTEGDFFECMFSLSKLRGRAVHTTDLKGFEGICESKEILPSGEKPFRHGGHHEWNSYGHKLGAVCLLDLSSSLDELNIQYRHWDILFPKTGVRYVFVIDEKLRKQFIKYRKVSKKIAHRHIPFVETWHLGSIPLSNVTSIEVWENGKLK